MIYAGKVDGIEWEVIEEDDTPEIKFFRIVDRKGKVLIDGTFEFGKYTFTVEGRDKRAVERDENILERDLIEMGLDEDTETLVHLVADDIASDEEGVILS